MDAFHDYLAEFESCIAQAVDSRELGHVMKIPTKPNALQTTPFGAALGQYIHHAGEWAIDYYGYVKRSAALEARIILVLKDPNPPRHIDAWVVHFASLHWDQVARFCPALVAQFPMFKQHVLGIRGFKR